MPGLDPRGYQLFAIGQIADRAVAYVVVGQLSSLARAGGNQAEWTTLGCANCSSSLRNLALDLIKMANDLRLMASGPTAGFGEILIPAVHAGSSIMPGKVNPSLAECLNMICFNMIGNDVSVAMAAQAGQFELNVMLPGMLKCVLDSTDMLNNFLPIFTSNMIDGLQANRKKLESYIEKSPVLVTLLNPYIGYQKAAEVYKESLRTNKSIREVILSKGFMTKEDLDKALTIDNLLGKNHM